VLLWCMSVFVLSSTAFVRLQHFYTRSWVHSSAIPIDVLEDKPIMQIPIDVLEDKPIMHKVLISVTLLL